MIVLGFLLLVIWSIAFPFINAFGLSRLFGINKQIDRSILLVLRISLSSMAAFNGFIIDWFVSTIHITDFDLATPYYTVPAIFINMVIVEGLVWQIYLKDRKMNGFLIALICTAAYLVPTVLSMCLIFSF